MALAAAPPTPPRRNPILQSEKKTENVRERREQNREEREREVKNEGFLTKTIFIVAQKPDPVTRTEPAQNQFPGPNARPSIFLHFLFSAHPPDYCRTPLLYFIFLIFFCTFSFVFFPLALHFVNSHAF